MGTTAKKAVRAAGPSTAALRKAGEGHARKQIAQTFANSAIKDLAAEYPRFEKDELKLGKVLGKGGFGTVYEVRGFLGQQKSTRSALDADHTTDPNQKESRSFIAKHCLRQTGEARYAVKVLSAETIENAGKYYQGIVDAAVETRVLSDIVHPNIIKLRALATCDPFNETYFIVMDRLYDTLESRVEKWASKSNRLTGLGRCFTDPKGQNSADLYEARLVTAFDLAAAVGYLHSRNIVYRDIKPENIGFDIRDDVKIFDFGLAKELHAANRNPDGTYNMTNDTGSLRYMAPEVANGKPYNATCDSYSFSILLWQILSMKAPYELYTPTALREKGECDRYTCPALWRTDCF